ncbi:MAG: hypothetical protein LBS66_04250 [Rhodospirillaceae bacterium]|jgi:hypothetical protein|nr:hypothetical protein [Rhodospirillaceae bacterium]
MIFLCIDKDLTKNAVDSWKINNIIQSDQQKSLLVVISLSGLDDWLLLRNKLTNSMPVRSYDLLSISKSEARIVLHFVGEQQQLESAFFQNGLILKWVLDHWILQSVANTLVW